MKLDFLLPVKAFPAIDVPLQPFTYICSHPAHCNSYPLLFAIDIVTQKRKFPIVPSSLCVINQLPEALGLNEVLCMLMSTTVSAESVLVEVKHTSPFIQCLSPLYDVV